MKCHQEFSLCGVWDGGAVSVPLVPGDGSSHGATLQLQGLPDVEPLGLRLDHHLLPPVDGVVTLTWRGSDQISI